MSHWTKLSKYCYVGRIGLATYWIRLGAYESGKLWRVTDDRGEVIGD